MRGESVNVYTRRKVLPTSRTEGQSTALPPSRTEPSQQGQAGRDLGPFSTRSTSKGSLLTETHTVFRALASGMTIPEVRAALVEGRLLRQAARETRHRIWEALHWRYFAWAPPGWVLADLKEAARREATDRSFIGFVYLHYARRDRLTFEFVSERLWELWKSKTLAVRRDDVLDFLEAHAPSSDSVRRWRQSTRVKLAGNVLSAVRDFGLLSGVQRKTLQRPVISIEVALHLCRLLDAEGLRGRSLLEADEWRLFLWDHSDTSDALTKLAQRGDIQFERSGRTVVLEIPERPRGGM